MEQGNPNWKPGVSGNPNGRPKGSRNVFSLTELKEAIAKVEKDKKKSFLEYAVERAYEEDKVLIALLSRLLPQVQEESDEEETAGHEIEFSVPHNGDGKERFGRFFN